MREQLARLATTGRRRANDLLESRGLSVSRRPEWGGDPQEIGTVIDVGSAYGTRELLSRFPTTPFVLIDPLEEYGDAMSAIVSRRGGFAIHSGVGSERAQMTISLDRSEPTKSSLQGRTALTATAHATEQRTIQVDTLDALLSELELREPFLLKIDTEGHELEVVRGAVETLSRTSILITETSVAPRFVGGYKFHELITEVCANGFELDSILTARPGRDGIVRFADLQFRKPSI